MSKFMNILKINILTVLLVSFIACSSNNAESKPTDDSTEKGLNWIENVEKAQEIAKEKNLPILVNFTGSDWCIWCKRLDGQIFSTDKFIEYANDNFVLLKIDFPRNKEQPKDLKKQNNEYARKYGIKGFPTILLLDENGNEVGRTGYQKMSPKEYIAHLEEFYKN